MTTGPSNLEEALQAVERDADAAIKALGGALEGGEEGQVGGRRRPDPRPATGPGRR